MIELIVIGTSAGGVEILNKLATAFSKTNYLKVAVVIHLAPDGPNLIPSLMGDHCALKVKEAEPGEPMQNDTIYVAPSDYHLCIEPNHILTLSSEEPLNFSRPSIDVLFDSAAYAYGNKVMGILLTGANHDGAAGLKTIQKMGGVTVVQNPSDAEWDVMPKSALQIMTPDFVLTTEEIINKIKSICSEGSIYAR